MILSGLFASCVGEHTKPVFQPRNQISVSESAININTASVAELERLPHVGAKTAEKIVGYRERYGRFRRAEHLLLIDGITENRFQAMKNFIKVE